ncbi:MAG: hypothetical protein ACR2IE_17260 [Candidatus Sumerlaeaceae bacterium]
MKSRNRKITRQMKRTAKVAAATCVLAGCSSTYVVTERANECNMNTGVPYYLPKRLAQVTVTKIEEGRFDAHLHDMPPVADPCQAYVAIPVKHWYRSDVIDIRTTPDGLLSSAYITGEQRNAGIQDNIRLSSVFFNKEGQKDELNRSLHFTQDAKTAALAGREQGIVVFEAAFDPGSPPDIDKVNASLKKYRMRLEVPVSAHAGPVQPQVDRVTGLVFRPAIQRPCYVKSTKDDSKVICSLNGVTPDQAPLFNLPLKGGLLAHHSHNLELREGVVTGYYSRRPSEIAGFFKQSQELVEDAGSVVAAVIAPLAAALDVKRTAENQSSSGTGGEGTGGAVTDPDAQAAADEKTQQQLEAQNEKIDTLIEQLEAQKAAAAAAPPLEEADAAGSQELIDILPAKKSDVAQKIGVDKDPQSKENTGAVAMPVRNTKTSKTSRKAAVASDSAGSAASDSAAVAYGAPDSAVPAFDPIQAGTANATPARPSFFNRVRSLVPLGRKPAADSASADSSAGTANGSRLVQGAGRVFDNVKETLPFRDTGNSGEVSDYASGRSVGYTSPTGGVNLSPEAAVQFANAVEANSAAPGTAGSAVPGSAGVPPAFNNPSSYDSNLSAKPQATTGRPGFFGRLKNVLPRRNSQSASPVMSTDLAASTAVANEPTPDLAAMPIRAAFPGTAGVPPAIDVSAQSSDLVAEQSAAAPAPRSGLFTRLRNAVPRRNTTPAAVPDSDYVAPAPVDAPSVSSAVPVAYDSAASQYSPAPAARPSLFSRLRTNLPGNNPAPDSEPSGSSASTSVSPFSRFLPLGRSVAAPETATPSQEHNVTLFPPPSPELSFAAPARAQPIRPAWHWYNNTTTRTRIYTTSAPATASLTAVKSVTHLVSLPGLLT